MCNWFISSSLAHLRPSPSPCLLSSTSRAILRMRFNSLFDLGSFLSINQFGTLLIGLISIH